MRLSGRFIGVFFIIYQIRVDFPCEFKSVLQHHHKADRSTRLEKRQRRREWQVKEATLISNRRFITMLLMVVRENGHETRLEVHNGFALQAQDCPQAFWFFEFEYKCGMAKPLRTIDTRRGLHLWIVSPIQDVCKRVDLRQLS